MMTVFPFDLRAWIEEEGLGGEEEEAEAEAEAKGDEGPAGAPPLEEKYRLAGVWSPSASAATASLTAAIFLALSALVPGGARLNPFRARRSRFGMSPSSKADLPRLLFRLIFLEKEEGRRGHVQRRKTVSSSPSLFLFLSLPLYPIRTHRMSALIPALTALSLAAAASSHRVCSAASLPRSSECASPNASERPSRLPSVALTYFSYLGSFFSLFRGPKQSVNDREAWMGTRGEAERAGGRKAQKPKKEKVDRRRCSGCGPPASSSLSFSSLCFLFLLSVDDVDAV